MKCRACWADKAYIRQARGWREIVMTWLGFVPLKCQHCYHKFSVLRLLTIGKQLTPPVRRTSSTQQQPVVIAHPHRNESTSSAAAPRLHSKVA